MSPIGSSRASGFAIVVATKNSGMDLDRLLTSVMPQIESRENVVIVDGGSTDDTLSIASHFGTRIIRVPSRQDNRSEARNIGAKASSGDYLLFLDSDMELETSLLQELSYRFSQGASAIIIPEVSHGATVLSRVRNWEREATSKARFLSFARAIRRDTFMQLGGFNEQLSAFEDLEFQGRILAANTALTTSLKKIVHYGEIITLRSYLHKRTRYLRDRPRFERLNPGYSALVFSPLARLRLYVGGVRSSRDIPLLSLCLCLRALERCSAWLSPS
jgi:glycosyltransferase involved in cell wall biosynthesis